MSRNQVPGRKKTSLSASQLCASDETFDLFCIPCNDDNKHIKASGYCVECRDYLCADCVQYHQKLRATKNHVIQDKDSMPRYAQQVHPGQQPKDICTEHCTKHPGKVLEYYCEPHNLLGCSVCVTLGHITCGVGYIPELSKGTQSSDEYKALLQKTKDMRKKFGNTKEKAKASIAEVENKKDAYTEKVSQTGEKIIQHVRDLVRKAIDEKDEFAQNVLNELRDSQEQCGKMIENINSVTADLESRKHSENQSFVLMKQNQLKMKEVEEVLTSTQTTSNPAVFEFVEHPRMKDIEEIKNMGTLSIKYKKVVKKHEDITVSTETDTTVPWITSLELLSDEKIGVVDNCNKSVKLVDTKDKTVSQITLENKPWNLTEVNKQHLAVTLPDESKIQFLSVSDTLTLGREIETDNGCEGIAAYQDKLIVSFTINPQVQILDMSGQVLKRITTDSAGEGLVRCPWNVAVNPNNKLVYVSDLTKKTVTCITLEGDVVFMYSDDNFENPKGLTMGENGSVYVCDDSSILHLTAKGTKVQTLLAPRQDGASSRSMAYDKNTGILYLGGIRENIIVYQLG